MRNVSLYDNLALLLEDMADKEEWKDHLAIIPYH